MNMPPDRSKILRNYIDGPDPLLIQGAALIETIYNKECLRPLGGVDILIDALASRISKSAGP